MLKKLLLIGGMLALPVQSFTVQAVAAPSIVKPTAKMVPTLTIESPKVKKKKQIKGEHRIMEVTAYTAGYESTQKQYGEEGYGEVAMSGSKYADFETVMVEEGVTVAAGKNIPFNTKIYIPYFKEHKVPGYEDGIFMVQDRGGAIGPNNIDVYMPTVEEALDFGRNKLDVYIMEVVKWEDQK
jgi:3D (Asp-Asp-Asp) domain-containing protein